MAGGAMPEQGGGGGKKKKKALDAVINVVPAIDLLSCLITFLLYTAVWTATSWGVPFMVNPPAPV